VAAEQSMVHDPSVVSKGSPRPAADRPPHPAGQAARQARPCPARAETPQEL